MAKTRVHELATELGMSSKELLDRLKGLGEYVKSASSTLEGPVERRVRETIAPNSQPAARPAVPFGGSRPHRAPRRQPPPPDWREAWSKEWIEPADAEAWVAAGLKQTDQVKAFHLAQSGVTPDTFLTDDQLKGRATSEKFDEKHTIGWYFDVLQRAEAEQHRKRAEAQAQEQAERQIRYSPFGQ